MKVRNLFTDQVHCAELRFGHAAASDGLPAVVLENGEAIEPLGWTIEEVSEDERVICPRVWRMPDYPE
jgi:hypothetical protein